MKFIRLIGTVIGMICLTVAMTGCSGLQNGAAKGRYDLDSYSEKPSNISAAIDPKVTEDADPAKQPAVLKDEILIDRLDKVSNETISYVYKASAGNIKVESKFEGNFTDSGRPEILAIFKLSGVPHAGGMDCSVGAVYDRDTLGIISQNTFHADECKFSLLKNDKGRSYLLFSGVTTYQGRSSFSLQIMKLGKLWQNILPGENSIYYNGNMRFEILPKDLVCISKPVFKTDGSSVEPEWKRNFYEKWDPASCTLKDYQPGTWTDTDGKSYFDADSVSADGKYAIVSHEWGFDSNSYLMIYDIKMDCFIKKVDLLAQFFGFTWSPDNKKVCVSRLARVWVDLSIVDIQEDKTVSILEDIKVFEKFKEQGVRFDYTLNENRPDQVFKPVKWSPDSNYLTISYEWHDSDYKLQSGTFDYDIRNRTVSKIRQNPPKEAG